MSLNKKKFIDRTPGIFAAGIRSDDLGDSVANCLKNYSINDAAEALKMVANISQNREKPTFKSEPYTNRMRTGIFTEVQPILQPPIKTRYQYLINELKETTYDSHWNKVIGKGRDHVPGLPRGLNPLETTFGKPPGERESIKELLNPSVPVYKVLTDSQIGHELYKKSHNDYNPGEQISRNYLTPAFDKTKRFGGHTKYDPRGIWVRCACTWHKNDPVVVINKTQSEFLNKTRSRLGECLTPNDIAKTVPPGFVYGKTSKKDNYGVEDLLKDSDCSPCQFKRDLKCWLKSFNNMRLHVKNRFDFTFSLEDLCQRFLHYDTEKCGMLPLEKFYEVCACYRVPLDKKNIEPMLRLLSIIQGDKINYSKFLEIANSKNEPITLMKIEDVPKGNQYYVTSSQAAACDYLIINNVCSPPAGIPSIRYDLARPVVPSHGCRADMENLGDETSSAILLNPSIYFNYGLSFRDFFIPRKKCVIRGVFERAGHKLDDVTFEKLWAAGVEQDKTGLVCVDTFNQILQKHYDERKTIKVDEATC